MLVEVGHAGEAVGDALDKPEGGEFAKPLNRNGVTPAQAGGGRLTYVAKRGRRAFARTSNPKE
jgi:hypothetical protein